MFYSIPLRSKIFFIVYQLLSIACIPFFILYLIVRAVRGKVVCGNALERLGFVPRPLRYKRIIWLHAVSAGEVLSLEYLIKKIQATSSSVHCYLTVGTATGYQLAQKNIPRITLSYLPYDFFPCIIIALWRIKPSTCVIAEAELWPNLIGIQRMIGIPCYLINARISKKTAWQQKIYNTTLAHLFTFFRGIYTQDQTTTTFINQYVTSTTPVLYGGTTKSFNVVKKVEDFKKNNPEENCNLGPLMLVGSCHPGELAIYLALFEECKKTISNLKLVLVPRHNHWQEELAKKIALTQFSSHVITSMQEVASFEKIVANNDIVTVFVMGTLFSLYRYATIFFLGGTWVPIGGHNLLEPAAWGIPSIVGPHYFSSTELVTTLHKNNALFIAHTTEELTTQTLRLLTDGELREATQKKSLQWLEQEAQGTEAIINTLLEKL